MRIGQQKVEKDAGPESHRAQRRDLRPVMWTALGLLAWAVLLFNPLRACAEGDDESEYRVKLAFLYNFAQFIQWPAEAFHNPAAPLMMCVAGPDPFQGEIEQDLHGRKIGGHPIEIRRLRPNDNPKACHMIFVRAGDKKQVEKLLAAVKGSSTLTVGETEGFADLGGVINLTLDRNRLRFEINLDAAAQTRLKFSSKLLALAKIVKVERNP